MNFEQLKDFEETTDNINHLIKTDAQYRAAMLILTALEGALTTNSENELGLIVGKFVAGKMIDQIEGIEEARRKGEIPR